LNALSERVKRNSNEKIERPIPENLCWSRHRLINVILDAQHDILEYMPHYGTEYAISVLKWCPSSRATSTALLMWHSHKCDGNILPLIGHTFPTHLCGSSFDAGAKCPSSLQETLKS
jgi:hypothetical protein